MRYLIPILLISLILITGCSIQDCNTDLSCFKELAKDCSRAKVNIKYEDNDVRLTSRGNWFGECKISLKIEKVGDRFVQEDPTLAKLAEGKTLNCEIPIEIVKNNNEQYIDEILNLEQKFDQYCSGPIKDTIKGPLKDIVMKKIN
jgi:hypothetical protein